MSLTVARRNGIGATVVAPQALYFGVQRRTGYGYLAGTIGTDPSVDPSINFSSGQTAGFSEGYSYGAKKKLSGQPRPNASDDARDPPYSDADGTPFTSEFRSGWATGWGTGAISGYDNTTAVATATPTPTGTTAGKYVPAVVIPSKPTTPTTTKPAATAETDHTPYYIAAGVLVAVGVGATIYFVTRKKHHRSNPRRNPRRRRSPRRRR